MSTIGEFEVSGRRRTVQHGVISDDDSTLYVGTLTTERGFGGSFGAPVPPRGGSCLSQVRA